MKVSVAVNDFLNDKVAIVKTPANMQDGMGVINVIQNDLNAFDAQVCREVLRGHVNLEGQWSSYIVTDIDIFYASNMVDFMSRLDLYGIARIVPDPSKFGSGVVFAYRFDEFSAYNTILDTLLGYHIGLMNYDTKEILDKKIFVY